MILRLSPQLLIGFFRHRLTPLVRGALTRHFHCQMREPAIGCSTVPVLDLRGNVHHIARMQLLRSFAPFLIVAPACHADKDLPTALCGMVDVPVVPAARLKGDIVNANLCGGQGGQIAFPLKYCAKPSLDAPMGNTISLWCFALASSAASSAQTSLAMRKAAHALGQPT